MKRLVFILVVVLFSCEKDEELVLKTTTQTPPQDSTEEVIVYDYYFGPWVSEDNEPATVEQRYFHFRGDSSLYRLSGNSALIINDFERLLYRGDSLVLYSYDEVIVFNR